jgi:predicted transposase/invertase (TIGR01784 family)
MADIAHPHDRFFRALLGVPAAANALFRERLPRELVEELTDSPPEPVETTFVDSRLKRSIADGLYRLRLRSRRPLYVYSLVEHKSAPEPRLALQLLGYMVRTWENEERQQGDGRKLPGIVPLVVYHGEKPWTVPASFRALVDLERSLWPKPLDFEMVVSDIGAMEDERLSREPAQRAGLLGLKYATRVDRQGAQLRSVLEALREVPSLVEPGFAYIMGTYSRVDRALLLGEVRKVMPEYEPELISIAAREWKEEGREQGQKEGREQGRRDSLLRVLELRFGSLADGVRERVAAGSAPEIEVWLERAVRAESLDAVFGATH